MGFLGLDIHGEKTLQQRPILRHDSISLIRKDSELPHRIDGKTPLLFSLVKGTIHCKIRPCNVRGFRTGKPGLENPSILAYASTKGALETLVRNWAAILGPSGIRVNAVAPGVIDTDMSNFTKTEAGREVALGMLALKRLGKPEDVADVVAFVASDAARWITGASIPVDGGSKL